MLRRPWVGRAERLDFAPLVVRERDRVTASGRLGDRQYIYAWTLPHYGAQNNRLCAT
jgi:hypothetical protein